MRLIFINGLMGGIIGALVPHNITGLVIFAAFLVAIVNSILCEK